MSEYSSTSLTVGATTRPIYFRPGTTDEAVLRQIFTDQHYDLGRLKRIHDLMEFSERHAAKGRRPLVVDAGANIGASALYFLAKLPKARVVAIEPDPENFKLLSKNVEGLDVEAIHGAVSSATGRARLIDAGIGEWGYQTRPSPEDGPDTVACVTIRDIYHSHAAGFFPFIVKIDIEGAEQDLFSAETEWVKSTPVLVIELHDWMMPKAGTSRPFLRCISGLDRDFVHIGENIFSIANDFEKYE